jgi:methyl-accepting chemotaxis protein
MTNLTRVSEASIGLRLGGAFTFLVMLLLGTALYGSTQLTRISNMVQGILDNEARPTLMAQQLVSQAHETAQVVRNTILLANVNEISSEITHIAKLQADSTALLDTLKAALQTPAAQQALNEVISAQPAYKTEVDKILGAVKSGDNDAARELIVGQQAREAQKTYVNALQQLVSHQQGAMDEVKTGVQSSSQLSNIVFVACAIVAAVAAAMVGLVITRSVVNPARQAIEVANRIASGDLSCDIHTQQEDEMGQLLHAMQAMQVSLRHTVTEIRQGATQVSTASNEIALGNQDLSNRTEHQAGALQQTASAMQQMTVNVQHNADNAHQANQLAANAVAVAVAGGDMVNRVVHTMSEISASSNKIADIIGVIDGIAFQTNILALNAAVEAARAGEQGRGFAVVAGEVRSLAQRSAEAAKEIKTLITRSTESVDTGRQTVDEAGQTMSDIVRQVQRVTDLIAEINVSSTEQTTGIRQINQSVTQLDEGTQQNAALVEQSAAAADSLRTQAATLTQLVSTFKV